MHCDLQIFSCCVCHLKQLHAQSPFLFPIVFSINSSYTTQPKTFYVDLQSNSHYLGAAVGSSEFVAANLNDKVAAWVAQVHRLTDVAATQRHAAFAAYVFGLRHRWTFIQSTMPMAGDHMQPLQDSIRGKLIPAVTKHQPKDLELEVLSLPAACGGMTFDDPVADSRRKHADSIKCTATLTDLIWAGEPCLPSGSTVEPDRTAKPAVRRQRQLNLIDVDG